MDSTELRDWKPWMNPEYAQSRLKLWGNPLEPRETWNKFKRERLSILPYLVEGRTLLDVGCGLGHSYMTIRDYVDEYLGVDLKGMIDICHTLFPKELFIIGDVFNLSQFGVYDTVLAIQLLIHLPELEKPLEELWEHTGKRLIVTLRPPGRVTRFHQRDSGLIGHDFCRATVTQAINNLGEVGAVNAYRCPFLQKRVQFIVIDRNSEKDIKIKSDIFKAENTKRIEIP